RFGFEERPFLDQSGIFPVYGIRMLSTGLEYKLTHDKVVDVSLTSMTLDGTPSSNSSKSLADDPLSILTLRGADYETEKINIPVLLVTILVNFVVCITG